MKTLYIVSESSGSYDSYSSWPIAAYETEDAARLFTMDMLERQVASLERQGIVSKNLEKWRTDNPRPQLKFTKDTYNKKKKQSPILKPDDNGLRECQDWTNRHYDAKLAFEAALGMTEQEAQDYENLKDDTGYDITEVPFYEV